MLLFFQVDFDSEPTDLKQNSVDQGISNETHEITNNNLEKKKTEEKDEVRSERESTPDQSPTTKAKLRKVCIYMYNFIVSCN